MTSTISLPPTLSGILGMHNQRLNAIERSDGSAHWINVANDSSDPLWTFESPPWQNGWGNVGGVEAPVSFKRFLNWVHIRGAFTGGVDGTVVFTLPPAYCPAFQQAAVGPLADGSGVYTYLIGVDGTVTYITAGAL